MALNRRDAYISDRTASASNGSGGGGGYRAKLVARASGLRLQHGLIEPVLPFIEEALDDIQDQTFIAQTEYAFLGEMHEQFQISG